MIVFFSFTVFSQSRAISDFTICISATWVESSFVTSCSSLLHDACLRESSKFSDPKSSSNFNASLKKRFTFSDIVYSRKVSFRCLRTQLRNPSLFLRFGSCLTSNSSVFFLLPSYRSVSASKTSKYLGFRSCLCCYLFFSRPSQVLNNYWYALSADTVFFWAKWLFTSAWCSSYLSSNSTCSLSSFLSWPDILYSVVFNVCWSPSSHRKSFVLAH